MRKICLRCGSKFGSQAEYCPYDGSLLVTDEEVPDPLLGTILLEQFRIDEQIGTGGMGTVYRAHQTTVGRDVAIKVLRPELARDDQAVLRFEREARLAMMLDHPNLVRVFLSGRLSDGRLYLVMELLEGRSLADELDEHGSPSVERAVVLIMKLCAGLGAVHAAGIVHRDIKPENIYLVRRGKDSDFVKLVDFGIARVLEAESVGPTTTQSGRIFGTATYISPEAATGQETDHRSDIYSLGVLSYQLLSGELPFEGSTAGALLMQHVHKAPPLLQAKGRGAEVPDDVARVVMRALSKDPDARPQTLAEFVNALAEAAGHAGLFNDARALFFGTMWGDELAAPGSYLAELLGSSPPPSPPSAWADTHPVAIPRDPEEEALLLSAPKPFQTTSQGLAAVPRPRKSRWPRAVLLLVGLALAGVVAGTWWTRRAPQEKAEAQPGDTGQAPMILAEKETAVPDVGTDAQVAQALIEELPSDEPAIEVPPDEAVVEEEALEPLSPKVKPKARKRNAQAREAWRRKAPSRTPENVSATAPTSGLETTAVEGKELEPDEGIDWTVPADFPDEPGPMPPVDAPDPAPPNPGPTKKPAPPTGTPEAPPRNPIVIDEPPGS
jgi:serine/threonine-protein kinase